MGRRIFAEQTDPCSLVHSANAVEYEYFSANQLGWRDGMKTGIGIMRSVYSCNVFISNIGDGVVHQPARHRLIVKINCQIGERISFGRSAPSIFARSPRSQIFPE